MICVTAFMSYIFLCDSQFLSYCRFCILQQLTPYRGFANYAVATNLSDQGVNPEASGAWGQSPRRKVLGKGGWAKPPTQKKKILQISVKSRKKKYKMDHVSKTKNRTKKVIYAKNERQINSNLPFKFGHFLKKLNNLQKYLVKN